MDRPVLLVGAGVAAIVVTRFVVRKILNQSHDDNTYTEIEKVLGQFFDRKFDLVYHDYVSILKVGNSAWTSRTTKIGQMNCLEKIQMYEEGYHSHYFDKIFEIIIINTRLASAKVQYAQGDDVIASALLLVKIKGHWQIIHEIQTKVTMQEGDEIPRLLDEPAPKTNDYVEVSDCVQRYISASIEADHEKLASLLAKLMRCVFIANDGTLRILPSEQFLDALSSRWRASRHFPYSHLKEDLRIPQSSAILHISLQSPRVAIAKIRLCIPPLAYNEILFLVKNTQDKSNQHWTIIAQSFAIISSFLENDIRPDMYFNAPPTNFSESHRDNMDTHDDDDEQAITVASRHSSPASTHRANAFDFIQAAFQDQTRPFSPPPPGGHDAA